ncbi:MAG TPA: patatin-like phospholipase family protein [Gammaproteobacteria bacterium]|nr:patatin-like phospholipase family protein [Gammaproteobacteria bacterium]
MHKKTVSLVLGSGAARGLAHIGVIEWLDGHGYRIESIAGASMGALVGGVYAAGELDSYREWVLALEKMDVVRFLDLAFSSEGLFKGDRLMDALREMVGERNIEDLPIAFTAVACDLDRQREVWFTDGPLFDAIRASIAIPTVFTPHRYRAMKLLDGGLVNPVPIAPTFRDMTDMTIAVDLNAKRDYSQAVPDSKTRSRPSSGETAARHAIVQRFLDSIQNTIQRNSEARHDSELGMLDLLSSAFETMQNAISSMKLAAYAPDVRIEIPRHACKAYEFERAGELIELGYAMAEKAMASGGIAARKKSPSSAD